MYSSNLILGPLPLAWFLASWLPVSISYLVWPRFMNGRERCPMTKTYSCKAMPFQVNEDPEVLMMIKTRTSRIPELTEFVQSRIIPFTFPQYEIYPQKITPTTCLKWSPPRLRVAALHICLGLETWFQKKLLEQAHLCIAHTWFCDIVKSWK